MELASQLVYISLVLFLAFLGGLLFDKLKLPRLVGYVVVGVVLGPSMLGFLHESSSISFLAELGIVLLLFVLGIELDGERFGTHLKKALTIGLLQVIGGVALMYGIGEAFGWPLELRILIGFIVALSSTAVAIGMLENINAQHTKTAGFAVAILIAQDILAIPMLLVMNAFGAHALDAGSLLKLGLSVILILFALGGIIYLTGHPKALARIDRTLLAGIKQPAVAALALCFGAAALTGSLGLSTAFGAFAAGLLIGSTSQGDIYRRAIEPIHDLLIMIFFLSVGLLVDVEFVLAHLLEIGLLLTATIILKTIFNYALIRAMNEPAYRAFTVSAALAQIGEFSLVLISAGAANGFIGEDGYQMALAVIVLSLIISPVWLEMIKNYLQKRGIYLAGNMPDRQQA